MREKRRKLKPTEITCGKCGKGVSKRSSKTTRYFGRVCKDCHKWITKR